MDNEKGNIVEKIFITVDELTEKFTHLKRVYKQHCFKYSRNEEDNEDTISDLYIKIMLNREKFDTRTNFSTWSNTVLKNMLIDKYRKNHKYVHVDFMDNDNDDDGFKMYIIDSKIQDVNNGENNFLVDDVINAVTTIENDRDRHMIELLLEGYAYIDIAEQLKLPLGTIKNRIHVSKKYLSKVLKEYDF